MKISVFWFRRDLRLEDNSALYHALNGPYKVLPIFIFDKNILSELDKEDSRITFIHAKLESINKQLKKYGSGLNIYFGYPVDVFSTLSDQYDIGRLYINKDYEPYARQRDDRIFQFLKEKRVEVLSFKDQVIFGQNEILKNDGKPYTVYTPYKNKWLQQFESQKHELKPLTNPEFSNFINQEGHLLSLNEIGFKKSTIHVKRYDLSGLNEYDKNRDYPSKPGTSYLSPHLRFGTVSIREIVNQIKDFYPAFLNELIWREFFMQILFHFPDVVESNFKQQYDGIEWRNNKDEFEKWCNGNTGYPIVDAGMRELNSSGYMHNRVRMVTASFLCKHLLIDWRWGEAYFAKKLLDYELASNNGNWQWAAGTGCDAAPYFRVFNPLTQQEKFDRELKYVKKWVPEFGTSSYPKPIVDHKLARERAIETYKKGLLK